MREITEEQFHNAVAMLNDEAADGKIDARRDYEGRGMWSASTCIAIVGSSFGDAVRFMIAIVAQIAPDVFNHTMIIAEMADDMLTDSMGKTKTIYYFPGWQVVD